METRSSVIFINSNVSGNGRLSSFVPAMLVRSVRSYKRNDIFALSFFCGAHFRREDPDSGIAGLMRSLISQLLMCHTEFELPTIRRISQVDPENVPVLCQIFQRLIFQLPPDIVVFCMVDAVTNYETSSLHMEDSEAAVARLIEIVQKTHEERRCAFKLLLTSPKNTHRLYKLVPEQKDVVWIPSRVPPTGGFTSMKWRANIDARMGFLDAYT